MKRIVLIVVGALVAIAMIPIIVVSINRITQEKVKEEVIIFEILTLDGVEGTITQGTYDLLYDKIGSSYNLIDLKVNDISEGGYLSSQSSIVNVNIQTSSIQVKSDDTINHYQGVFDIGDTFEITFEVTTPAQVTGVGAALLGLVPILFVLGTVFSLVIFTKEWN